MHKFTDAEVESILGYLLECLQTGSDLTADFPTSNGESASFEGGRISDFDELQITFSDGRAMTIRIDEI